MRRKNKKTGQSRRFEQLTYEDQQRFLLEHYEMAKRIGSIRAVETRVRMGNNRLYRWVKKMGLPVPKPEMGPKKNN
jgi:hypothetical protein